MVSWRSLSSTSPRWVLPELSQIGNMGVRGEQIAGGGGAGDHGRWDRGMGVRVVVPTTLWAWWSPDH
jgi:hypothetical protein